MEWLEYQKRYLIEASLNDVPSNMIEEQLSYAKRLHTQGYPIIFDTVHLANLLGVKSEFLAAITNDPSKFYRTFKIKKRNGTDREISEPLPELKNIQKWILNEILNKTPISNYAKAYIKKRSTKSGAAFHRNQKNLAVIDIENFFGSIGFGAVLSIFSRMGFSRDVSVALTNLCILDAALPQGAPTSPILSNIFMNDFDTNVSSFARTNHLRYTRYADDLAFSGVIEMAELVSFIKIELRKKKLKVNTSKTRCLHSHQRQIVTGIVVNQKLQAPIEYRKLLRQENYYIRKYGLASHLLQKNEMRTNYLNHLLGKAHYVLHLNSQDKIARETIELIKKLNSESQL